MKGVVNKILDPEVKTGQSTNKTTGKPFTWTLAEVEVTKEDGEIVKARGFDLVADNDTVELVQKPYEGRDGKTYQSWNFALPKASYGRQNAQESQAEVLQAIRMVYKEVKVANEKLDKLLGIDEELTEPDQPVDEEEAKQPPRDWSSVGKAKTGEPTVEPLPEPPEDLESFMNGN